ncbi:MAG: ATP-dependent DNA helicase RecG [Bacillales bacterium]|nr:ATP-dependent DNA helicase RecG [Bacillales bacterium]
MELNIIKGIGDKTITLLNKLNIYTIDDLVNYYPFRYEILEKTDLNSDRVVIDGVVETSPLFIRLRGKLDKMSFRVRLDDRICNVVIFNRGFLRNNIKINTTITIIGKYDIKHNTITASDIKFGSISSLPKITPVYHTVSKITSKQINNYILKVIDDIKVTDIIPSILLDKYKLIPKSEAIREIHRPDDMHLLKNAINHIKYEELFLFMLKMNELKRNRVKVIGIKKDVDKNNVLEFINNLPFKLTNDQLKVVDEIYNDLTSNIVMNRLVQGDVGSGKTIVSFIAIYINYLAGYQSALMAPTELLAYQHYLNIKNIFKDYDIKVELLTGKTKNKKKLLEDLKNNKIDVLIGTHALIEDSVVFNNLGLVITDEQHRFGVNQRSNLKNKGINPDILYMSATPIPRTYALTIYGDMDVSSIKTMPSGRVPVKTYLKKNSEIKEVLTMMYEELKNKHQIYVIAPLIEESDKIDLENVYELEEKFNKAFKGIYKVGVLHGKMTKDEKDNVMESFKNNDIQILISTTVIEVGIDIPNATMMVIFDSYRFGLSQLHQLRGRVGRNSLQSYCILISDYEKERLDILTLTTDGFKISEEDFRLRGSGDLFGIRQSGDMSFRLADIKKDYNILIKAKEDANYILDNIDNYPYLNKLINDNHLS